MKTFSSCRTLFPSYYLSTLGNNSHWRHTLRLSVFRRMLGCVCVYMHSRARLHGYTTSSRETTLSRPETRIASETEDSGVELAPGKKLGPWRPLKKLTREEMDQMKGLKQLQPDEWTNSKLAKRFGVSSSAVKRILRSKFDPEPQVEERQERRVLQLREERRERLRDRGRQNTQSSKAKHSE